MMASLATTLRVSVDAPERIWNWVLAKQGLGEGNRLASANSAAERSLGFHSARVGSPYATAAARTDDEVSMGRLLGEVDDSQLVTIRCMRKTLHTLPVEMASYAHAATRRYRLRDVAGLARRAGLAFIDLEPLAAEVKALLGATGQQSHREIEQVSWRNGHDVIAARLALKLIWERGEVTYRNCSSSWNREDRRFQLRELSHPGFNPDLPTEDGIDYLVEAYFTRYGPATLQDASWWSGLGKTRIAESLAELDVVKMELPWAPSTFYMTAAAFAQYQASSVNSVESGVNLLAHEDVALKAYFESRSRYLGSLAPERVYNLIGEARPTILHDGQVVGLWEWSRAQRRIRYRHFRNASSAIERMATRRRVIELERRLQGGYAGQR